MLKEVRFGFRHEGCWLQETSEAFSDLTIVVSSIYLAGNDVHADLTVHAAQASHVSGAARRWEDDPRIRRVTKVYEGPRGTRFHVSYSKDRSIYPEIIQHTPISLGTIRIAQGREHYSLVGESDDVSDLLQVLSGQGTLEVESIRRLKSTMDEDGVAAEDSWTKLLTLKQQQAVLMAHRSGYYRWPRDLSASKLAQQVGLSSSAFLEHLRQAEARILDVVVAQMRGAEHDRPADESQ